MAKRKKRGKKAEASVEDAIGQTIEEETEVLESEQGTEVEESEESKYESEAIQPEPEAPEPEVVKPKEKPEPKVKAKKEKVGDANKVPGKYRKFLK